MSAKRIYHYTSIESLALILKNRNLRFTRLDHVDDVREAQSHFDINFGQYFFVSCWTQQEEESIPQWNMYSREMQGVRIELPEYPFANYRLEPKPDCGGINWDGVLKSPWPFEALWGPSYFIVPWFSSGNWLAGPVKYVPSVAAKYAQYVRREMLSPKNDKVEVESLPMLPRYKSIEWEFQKEYRFSLFVFPSLPVPARDDPSREQFFNTIGNYQGTAFNRNKDPGITYIDVPLAPTALHNLVVRTGPKSTPGGQTCIEALVRHFAPEARIEQSVLSGTIRNRKWYNFAQSETERRSHP
ncbi:MAG: hypothetical protein ACU836_18375 [Gammaproteobacteria bacterium]